MTEIININPYLARKADSSLSAPTAANFPALKHYWDMEDVTDNASANWTDRIGSFVLSLAGADKWRKNANGVYGNTVNSTFSGTLANFSTKHTILFANIGELTATNQHFGFYDIDAAGVVGYLQLRMRITGGAEHYAGINQLNFLTYANWSTGGVTGAAFGMTYANLTSSTGANSACYRSAVGGSMETTSGVATGVALNTSITTGNEGQIGATGTSEANSFKVKSFGIMVFSSTPPDLAAAAAYMRDNPGKIFPGWFGLV